jgi:predicted RNA-binding protein associated with RNAse of E/G family
MSNDNIVVLYLVKKLPELERNVFGSYFFDVGVHSIDDIIYYTDKYLLLLIVCAVSSC